MIKTRSRGRMEPPEVYCGTPLGICPECREDVDEDEPHETLDGQFTHTACLPFCSVCRDALLHDTCEDGYVNVEPGPVIGYSIVSTRVNGVVREKHYPVRDKTFSGRFCGFCFPRSFFPEGDD